MFVFFAALSGFVITVMNGVNSIFTATAGSIPAILIIHLSGLVTVMLVLLFRGKAERTAARGAKPPFYLCIAGVFGVGVVFLTTVCFARIGASLTTALSVFGQIVASALIDSTGFLGMTRYPFRKRKLVGLAIITAGIAVMAGNLKMDLPFILLAFTAGAVNMVGTVINARLAVRIGLFRGVRINYIAGFSTIIVVALLARTDLSGLAAAVVKTGPFVAIGGGFLGVVVVASTNFVMPRIPALYASLVMFVGQSLAGILIDAIVYGTFSWREPAGTAIILAGLMANIILEKAAASKALGQPARVRAWGTRPHSVLKGSAGDRQGGR